MGATLLKKGKIHLETVKCLIEKGVQPKFDRAVEEHISKIEGRGSYVQPTYYRNIETGEEYLHLAGGLGWPSNGIPGYCCIIGVDRPETKEEEPSFRVLDEKEDLGIKGLLEKCKELREKWGYKKNSELFQIFYGDYEAFPSIVHEFNTGFYRNPGDRNGLYISPPSGFELRNSFQIYIQKIREFLSPNKAGKKRLYLGGCEIIKNRLSNLPPDAMDKGDMDKFIAIATVGSVLHSLSESKPWEIRVCNGFDDDPFGDEY
jgi:hypothetical protein